VLRDHAAPMRGYHGGRGDLLASRLALDTGA
jgi:hypothetical protein